MKKAQTMILAILIIGAATIAIGISIAALSSTELKIILRNRESLQAYSLTQTCLENSLMKMSRTDIETSSSFTLGAGSCTIQVSGGGPYQVLVTSKVGQTTRQLTATVGIDKEILKIESLQELYD